MAAVGLLMSVDLCFGASVSASVLNSSVVCTVMAAMTMKKISLHTGACIIDQCFQFVTSDLLVIVGCCF